MFGLTYEDIKRHYNAFLEKEGLIYAQVILSAGGAMVMHGLRKTTNDLDIEVPPEHFDKLLNSGKYPIHKFDDVTVIEYSDEIEVHSNLTFKDVINLDNVMCYSTLSILTQKLELNREKDQNDIKILRG